MTRMAQPRFAEAPVVGANVALGVRVHVEKTGVPEEPYILLVGNRAGVKQIIVNLGFMVVDQANDLIRHKDLQESHMDPCHPY